MRRLLGLLLACAPLVACSHKSSSDGAADGSPIPTDQMYLAAHVSVRDDANARVSARVDDGRLLGEFYDLTGGDRFTACVVDRCEDLTRDFGDALFEGGYDHSFPYVAEESYVVSLTRPRAVSAPTSQVSLPGPFVVLTPAVSQQIEDGEIVTVTWQPVTADQTTVTAVGECLHIDGIRSPTISVIQRADDGAAAFAVDDLFVHFDDFFRDSDAAIDHCDVVIEID